MVKAPTSGAQSTQTSEIAVLGARSPWPDASALHGCGSRIPSGLRVLTDGSANDPRHDGEVNHQTAMPRRVRRRGGSQKNV